MDRKRDGPFKVGDRVRTTSGGSGKIIERDEEHTHTSGDSAPNLIRFDGTRREFWWTDGNLTLISPATEPEAQEDVEFKKGDRVEMVSGCVKYTATYVEMDGVCCKVVRDDGKTDSRDNIHWWVRPSSLRRLSTEPIAAQKETTMHGYEWLVWELKDGARDEIVSQGAYDAYENKRDAEMEVWAKFKGANEDAELKDYEVEVHPFGG